MTVGEKIKKYRLEKGLTLEELANKTGYKSKTAIHKIENGKSDLPIDKIEIFSKALDINPLYLLGFDEEKPIVKGILDTLNTSQCFLDLLDAMGYKPDFNFDDEMDLNVYFFDRSGNRIIFKFDEFQLFESKVQELINFTFWQKIQTPPQ